MRPLGALFIVLSPVHTKGPGEASELRFLAKNVSALDSLTSAASLNPS
jgi:hypothetical protein